MKSLAEDPDIVPSAEIDPALAPGIGQDVPGPERSPGNVTNIDLIEKREIAFDPGETSLLHVGMEGDPAQVLQLEHVSDLAQEALDTHTEEDTGTGLLQDPQAVAGRGRETGKIERRTNRKRM